MEVNIIKTKEYKNDVGETAIRKIVERFDTFYFVETINGQSKHIQIFDDNLKKQIKLIADSNKSLNHFLDYDIQEFKLDKNQREIYNAYVESEDHRYCTRWMKYIGNPYRFITFIFPSAFIALYLKMEIIAFIFLMASLYIEEKYYERYQVSKSRKRQVTKFTFSDERFLEIKTGDKV